MTDQRIAVVVLDSLRADSFAEHFDLPGTTYENAWAPGTWTAPVHGSLMTGRCPDRAGITTDDQQLDTDTAVLAERLGAAGYSTAAFSANPNISPTFAFDRGFDRFETTWQAARSADDVVDWGAFVTEHGTSGVGRYVAALRRICSSDVDTWESLRQAIRHRASGAGIHLGTQYSTTAFDGYLDAVVPADREFLFANLMEAHAPYECPGGYESTDCDYTPTIRDTVGDGPPCESRAIRQTYEDAVSYLADQYRDIHARLRKEYDIVITLGDHGELFGVDGAWEHTYGIYPGLAHVPLSVWDGSADDTRTSLVSVRDVFRTVLSAAGVAAPSDPGVDIRSQVPDRRLLVQRHGLTAGHKTALREDGWGDDVVAHYDTPIQGVVSSVGYAFETADGIQTTGDVDAATGRAWLDDARELETSETAADPDVPAAVEGQLADLGYL